MNNYSYLNLFIFIIGVILTVPLSQFLSQNLFLLFKKLYQSNNIIQTRQTLYSCWAGYQNGNLIYLVLTFFIIFMSISSYFNQDMRLLFFPLVCLLFLAIACWNSLTRIEITKEGISIYKMVFGTETEIYKIKNEEIKSFHIQHTQGNFLLGGFHHWYTITLKTSDQILLAAPEKEDLTIILEFMKDKKIKEV